MIGKDIRRRMSDKHEAYIAELLGTKVSPGSGNQSAKPMDGRQDHRRQPFAFAFDCKATRADSISVSRAMWKKAVEQSYGERTLLPLRWYQNDRLTEYEDVCVIGLDDLIELIEAANGN